MPDLAFLLPGRLETLTGGYVFDRRVIEGLGALGWRVDVVQLDDRFPAPSHDALDHAAAALAALPDEALVVIDGLAMGAMPDQVEHERGRLRIVALVHHPLGAETGLDAVDAQRLIRSEQHALACARLVVVTSDATAEMVHRMGVPRDRLAVVEPGTDAAALAVGSGGPDVHMLSVATLTPRKGHAILFEALAALPDGGWQLDCVGSRDRDPATTARLEAQLTARQLTSRVRLRGEMTAAELDRAYHRADVFVLPTLYEGYGMAVAEAVAHGLPVVSTRTGAIPSLVPTDAGILVEPGDVEDLRAALAAVVGDRQERVRLTAGARRARERATSWREASQAMARALERVEGAAGHG